MSIHDRNNENHFRSEINENVNRFLPCTAVLNLSSVNREHRGSRNFYNPFRCLVLNEIINEYNKEIKRKEECIHLMNKLNEFKITSDTDFTQKLFEKKINKLKVLAAVAAGKKNFLKTYSKVIL